MDNIITEDAFTVDTFMKEIKRNLNKYETFIKKVEHDNNQNDLSSFMSHNTKTTNEIEKLKTEIDDNIKMVQSILTKDEHKFLLNTYKQLKDELNKRYIIAKKTQIQKQEQQKFNNLLMSTNTGHSQDNKTNNNIDNLTDEQVSLKNSIALSNSIISQQIQLNQEIDDQERKLGKSEEQVIKILRKVPLIEQMFGKIQLHKIKEKIILGIVIGCIITLGIYLTFYR